MLANCLFAINAIFSLNCRYYMQKSDYLRREAKMFENNFCRPRDIMKVVISDDLGSNVHAYTGKIDPKEIDLEMINLSAEGKKPVNIEIFIGGFSIKGQVIPDAVSK